ncbi:homeobox and C2H2 transcription factor, putative [Talaromyces stipitatus ATCC 10500]|uniref:Homeobox and C2H2 transcription factor, putative n=1 Tax=Talaromyces stipitatus (strain ATCC 10500 / CBS 375.48 / QM 6759 / NRRL 1006) TaxID=441959 RepID=B8MI17_TALSN|nr:homeobox and C2H2 transcription factor, putative [Talaromyces stipitatus ATCC 10500]EED17179.1 homeobox and C2H2 transcription factor, putative [Talaromyces stipitatus ATCC 10500]
MSVGDISGFLDLESFDWTQDLSIYSAHPSGIQRDDINDWPPGDAGLENDMVFVNDMEFSSTTIPSTNEILPMDSLDVCPEALHSITHQNAPHNQEAIVEPNNEFLDSHTLDLRTNGYRPPVPCEYCKKHRLQCLVIRTTKANPNPIAACSSCVALFRSCSLAERIKRHPCDFETHHPVVGGLHGITEADLASARSLQMSSDLVNKPEDASQCQQSAKQYSLLPKRTSSRMRGQTKALRQWFFAHSDHPYPTEEEKNELARESGLTRTQTQNWFINARRRQRIADKSRKSTIHRSGSPMPQSVLSGLTPFQRWRSSPPEDDHAPLELIKQAAISQPKISYISSSSPNTDRQKISNSYDSHSSSTFASSIAYSDSSESISSVDTFLSADSHEVIRPGSTPSKIPTRTKFSDRSASPRKSDWSRHEVSIHIQLDTWVCEPQNATVWKFGSINQQCNYCGVDLPSEEHIASHDFESCFERPLGERMFARKDHLWQHLKKFHSCDSWAGQSLHLRRTRRTTLNSRCGFCAETFTTWNQRTDHLVRHFKEGSQMNQWMGDWGFDAATTQSLKRAILPSARSDYFADAQSTLEFWFKEYIVQ